MYAEFDHSVLDKNRLDDAGIVDLCLFLSQPARYLAPEMVARHLTECYLGEALSDIQPSQDWVDRFIFQRFLMHLDVQGARREISITQDTPSLMRARQIALAQQSQIDRFAIMSAAAQLRPFLISSVLKRQLIRQREIITVDGCEIVFGGAQFLYRGIDAFGSPCQAYEDIFHPENTVESARNSLIVHGRTLLKAALKTVSIFWAEVFAFRFFDPPVELTVDAIMDLDIAGSLFKLWDRKCHDVLNT
jgi:hypothetical protein